MSYFADKVCSCEGPKFSSFKYTDEVYTILDDLDAGVYTEHMPLPPTCGRCGGWFPYQRICTGCGQEYFHWFWHHREVLSKSLCWNCIVDSDNPIHPLLSKRRHLKPHPDTLPPGYTLATRRLAPELSAAILAVLAKYTDED